MNASNWSVKGTTCNYYSPLFTVSGSPGGPIRELSISVRINQSGNLDGNDTARVYMFVNGVVIRSKTFLGAGSPAVFIWTDTIPVPSGGNYMVQVNCKNDRTNELWQIKNGDVTACLKSLSLLPITLTEFTAKSEGENQVRLDWTTQTEVNNDYFTLERSPDGKEFEEIGTVKGSGTVHVPHHYYWIDESPLEGINYYRLKQTDYNGATAVFKVVCARVGNISKSEGIKVFPNPFSTRFSIEHNSEMQSAAEMQLVSQSGMIVFRKKMQLDSGNQIYTFEIPQSIAPGQYLVRLIGQEGILGTAKVFAM